MKRLLKVFGLLGVPYVTEQEEDKKVKLVVTRLKGHETLWWDSVQAESKKKNKSVKEALVAT